MHIRIGDKDIFLASEVVTKEDFLACVDGLVARVWDPPSAQNHTISAYVRSITGAIDGRNPNPKHPLIDYEECSWRHFAEILSSACSRD